MSNPQPYFRVKILSVRQSNDNGYTWNDYNITQDTKDSLYSTKYELVNNKHYHPNKFVNYMQNIMNDDNKSIYNVYFKYIFFDHPIDNEYQNIFRLENNEMKLLI